MNKKSRPNRRLLVTIDHSEVDLRITSLLMTSSSKKWPSNDIRHRAVVSTFAPNPFIRVSPSPSPHWTRIWPLAWRTELGAGILAEDEFLADSLIHCWQFLLASRKARCSGGTPPQEARSAPDASITAAVLRAMDVVTAILASMFLADSRTLVRPQQTAMPALLQTPWCRRSSCG